MPHWNNQPWQRNLSKIASGKPGAVHSTPPNNESEGPDDTIFLILPAMPTLAVKHPISQDTPSADWRCSFVDECLKLKIRFHVSD
jgi:hypothetical protein